MQGLFSNLLIHGIQNVSLVVWTDDAHCCAEIRRPPIQVDFAVRDGLHHVSWMVSKVEKTAETRGLAAGNEWVIACKLHPMCIEMF
jgi:hypothetical protein